MLLGMGRLFLLVNARTGLENPFFRLPITLTYHGGVHICMLFGIALLLYLLNAGEWERRHHLALGALFVDASLAMASDRLVILQLFARSQAGFAAGAPADGRLGRRHPPEKSGAAGRRVGLRGHDRPALASHCSPSWQDVMSHYPFTMENGWTSLEMLAGKWQKKLEAGDELHWLTILWLTACVVHLSLGGWRRYRGGTTLSLSPTQRGMLFLSAHYLALTVTCVAAVCFSGIVYDPPYTVDFDWGELLLPHFLPVLFLPFFLIGLWLVLLPAAVARFACAAALGLFVFVAVDLEQCVRMERADDRSVWHYYPPFVRELDSIAEEYGLECGLAGYWEAKVATLLSRRGLRVHAVIANRWPAGNGRLPLAQPFSLLSRCGEKRCAAPRYQFILVKEFQTIPTPPRGERSSASANRRRHCRAARIMFSSTIGRTTKPFKTWPTATATSCATASDLGSANRSASTPVGTCRPACSARTHPRIGLLLRTVNRPVCSAAAPCFTCASRAPTGSRSSPAGYRRRWGHPARGRSS